MRPPTSIINEDISLLKEEINHLPHRQETPHRHSQFGFLTVHFSPSSETINYRCTKEDAQARK